MYINLCMDSVYTVIGSKGLGNIYVLTKSKQAEKVGANNKGKRRR